MRGWPRASMRIADRQGSSGRRAGPSNGASLESGAPARVRISARAAGA